MPPTKPLVDDSPFGLKTLARVLDFEGNFAIVGTATNGHQAILKAFALRAEVMLMDHRMPGVNGIEATLFIKQFQNAPLVIMVTSDYSSAYRARAKAAGADGFVDKGGDIRSQLHNLFHDQFRSRREPLEPV